MFTPGYISVMCVMYVKRKYNLMRPIYTLIHTHTHSYTLIQTHTHSYTLIHRQCLIYISTLFRVSNNTQYNDLLTLYRSCTQTGTDSPYIPYCSRQYSSVMFIYSIILR